jgi:prevent-host-death family protein
MEQLEVLTISQFKATCLAVLDKVKRTNQAVLITRRGEPIAMINPPPLPEHKKSWLGSFRSRGRLVGDIVAPVIGEKEWEVLGE